MGGNRNRFIRDFSWTGKKFNFITQSILLMFKEVPTPYTAALQLPPSD